MPEALDDFFLKDSAPAEQTGAEEQVVETTPKEGEQETTPTGVEAPAEGTETKTPEGGEQAAETPEGQETPEVPEYLKKFSEISGGKFELKSDEDLKKFFETVDKKNSELSEHKANSEFVSSVKDFLEKYGDYDPIKKMGGEENYKKNVIAQRLAEKGNKKIAEQLAFEDLSKVSDLDIMGLYAQYRSDSLVGNNKAAIEAFLDSININTEDLEEWSTTKQLMDQLPAKKQGAIALKAAEIREQLQNAKNSIEVPQIENPIADLHKQFEEKKIKSEELKGQWKDSMNHIEENLKKLEISEFGFDFEIKEDVKPLIESYISTAAKKGFEPNEANKQKVLDAIKNEIWQRDRNKILAAFSSHREAKIKEEYEKKYKNLTPLSATETPPGAGGTNAQDWFSQQVLGTKK